MNTFSDPKKIIESLPIDAHYHVADFGAGSGAYTKALVESLSSNRSGRVYAIDVQKELLESLHGDLPEQKHEVVHTVWSDLESDKGSQLRDDSIDMVCIANMLFQTDDPAAVIHEAYRVLKPEALCLIVDWSDSFGNIGPKESEIMNTDQVKEMAQKKGFEFVKNIDAGEHHFGLIFKKA